MGPRGLLITLHGGLYVHSLFLLFPPFIRHLYTCHLINVKPSPFASKTFCYWFLSFISLLKRGCHDLIPSSINATHVCLYKTSFTEQECCEILPDGLWTSPLGFKPEFTRHTPSINVFHAILLDLNMDGIKSLKDYNSEFYWQRKKRGNFQIQELCERVVQTTFQRMLNYLLTIC